MMVDPFVLGVLATVFAEMALFIIFSVVAAFKNK